MGNINDFKDEDWHRWDIALSDFAGVDKTRIKSIGIGFGVSTNTVAGGTGTVWFDDIRLYPSKCVPAQGPAYDWSGNCIVDYADLRVMAADWLKRDKTLSPVTDPGAANLVGWWKFEGNADDSTVNNNDGTAQGSYAYVTGMVDVNAIELSGSGGKVIVPNSASLNPTVGITVATWMNFATAQPSYSARVVVKGLDEGNRESYCMQHSANSADFAIRDVTTARYSVAAQSNLSSDEWIHVAGTYDNNSLKLYINGSLDNKNTIGAKSMMVDTNSLAIGNRPDADDRAYIGKLDDVRIYNRALTAAEIAYVGFGPTGYVPLLARSNISDAEAQGSKVVNFKDYAEFMTQWLYQQLWP